MARMMRRVGHLQSLRRFRATGRDAWLSLELLCALFVSTVVRLSYLLRQDFTLSDGEMFYLMTQELQRARYTLPAFTAYNEVGIPFAYPPLGRSVSMTRHHPSDYNAPDGQVRFFRCGH